MNKLNFGVSKKDFYDSQKALSLNMVDIDDIAVSNKVKGNNETSKNFIGYMAGIDVVTPLCIIL